MSRAFCGKIRSLVKSERTDAINKSYFVRFRSFVLIALIGLLLNVSNVYAITYSAAVYNQTPSGNLTYEANSTQTFTLAYTNTGTNNWQNSGGVSNLQYIELRSVDSGGNPVNSGVWPGSGWINAQRVTSLNAASVAPSQNGWFIFSAKMPSTPGDYYFYFRPYHAAAGFIGETRYFHVQVTAPPPVVVTPSLSVSKTSMNVGDTVAISCNLTTAGSGRPVAFFINNGSNSVATKSATADSSGMAYWTPDPSATSAWQPSVSVQCRDDSTMTSSAWKSITVNAQAITPSLSVSKTSMNVGDTVAISCNLTTAGSGRPVAFFINNGSNSVATKSATADSSGMAYWTPDPSATSAWQPSVSVQCRDDSTMTSSAWKSITVNAQAVTSGTLNTSASSGSQIYTPSLANYQYRYGPSIMLNGNTFDMWASAPGPGDPMDYIQHRRGTVDASGNVQWLTSWTNAIIATPGSMDKCSTCDPSVVYFNGYYYIGYTSTDQCIGGGKSGNQVFVARCSGLPNGSVTCDKWNGTGWGGNPQPIIRYSGTGWGKGQPSFVVKGDTLYMYYTDGGTKVVTVDATNPNWPSMIDEIQATTVLTNAEATTILGGKPGPFEVKYIDKFGKFIGIGVSGEFGAGSNIFVYESIDGISFQPVATSKSYWGSAPIQQFAHNIGISGDSAGHLDADANNFVAYGYGLPASQLDGQGYKARWPTYLNLVSVTASDITTTSLIPSNPVYGTDGSVTVTVSFASGTPTGNVTLSVDGGAAVSQALSAVSGSSPPAASAVFTITKPAAGSHTLSANYATQGGLPSSSASGTQSVAQRPLTITADAKVKYVGAADPALYGQITAGSLAAGDSTGIFTGSLTRVAGETVGTYAIQQGTATAGSNYQITFVGANLTITDGTDTPWPSPLPLTGQTSCYDTTSTVIPCTGTGQDGELQMGVDWPNPRFVENSIATAADLTVTDKLTGLIWTKNGNLAAGTKNWQQALDYIKTLNSSNYLEHNDWRLPNINELESLANMQQLNTATWLNTQGFTNVQANDYIYYWSSTSSTTDLDYAWFVKMDDGQMHTANKTRSKHYIWPVRSGQLGTITLPKTGQASCYDATGTSRTCTGTGEDGEAQSGTALPFPRFNDNSIATTADLSVTDNLTGLIWTKSGNLSYGTWQEALDYIKTLNSSNYLSHNDWRLPNINDLASLVHFWSYPQEFTNAQEFFYCSSSTYARDANNAWIVLLGSGVVGTSGKTNGCYVWPVRGGQSGRSSVVSVSPATGDFGSVQIGQSSAPEIFTIGNGGNADLVVSSISTTGGDSSVFSISAGNGNGGNCGSLTPTLAPSGSCTVSITFSSASSGAKSATLRITSNDPNTPNKDVPLSGTGVLPPVNGLCGSANGLSYVTAPTINLCSTGTASTVTGTGPWTWTCAGVNGGTDATCSASFADTTPPTIMTFVVPTAATTLTVPITTFTASDNVGVTNYCLTESNSSADCTWSSTKPTNYIFSGILQYIATTKTLYAWAKDAADNVSANRSASITITRPDTTIPIVTGFAIPATSNGLTVPVSTLTATDNMAVTGYLLTETASQPQPDNPAWTATIPLSHTFATQGVKTLYAFAKDAAGNISVPLSVSVTIALPDTTAPTVTVFTIPATSVSLAVSGISVASSDNVGVTGYLLTESSIPPAATDSGWSLQTPTAYTFADQGSKTLYAWAKDAAGNVSAYLQASVTINLPLNGTCGSSNGGTFTIAPATNLCLLGTVSSVTGTGPWNWSCSGTSGGTTATCSTNIQTFTIPVTVPGGNGTISCTSPVNYNATSTCTITPATGYQLATLTDNGADKKSIVFSNGYIINNVTSTHNIAATFAVLTVINITPPAPVPQTGQTICYDSPATVISCSGSGQDAELKMGVAWPNPRFVDNGDQTVTDKLTGLIWSKDANPAAATKTWQEALNYVKMLNTDNYLGHNDWRLPNYNELESLVNKGQANTAIWLNEQGFTNVQTNSHYWSSSTLANNTYNAWDVYMYFGSVNISDKAIDRYVWPVRGGQSESFGSLTLSNTGQSSCYDASGATIACSGTGQDGELQSGAVWPSPRFADNGDQSVTDNLSGLVWSKDGNAPGPGACGPGTYKTWQGALDYVKCLNSNSYLGKSDWRLPNRNELASLVNKGQANSATWLNVQGFLNVQSDGYWSSSTYVNYTDVAWFVYVDVGNVGFGDRHNLSYVWPVRAGQSGLFGSLSISKSGTGSGSVTSSPAGISCGATCSAISTTGTSVTLSPTPDSGSTFMGWSGCDSTLGMACTVTMSTDKNVTATFNLIPAAFTLTFTSGGNGTLTGTTSQPVNYGGSTTTVTAIPATGYHFVNWTEGTTVVSTSAALTISNVTAAHSFMANFALTPVPGVCGSYNNHYFRIAPTAGLCSPDSVVTVSPTGSGWTWACPGSNSGTSASCSATLDTTPPTLTLSTLADKAVTNNSTLNISGSVNDAGGIKSLVINNVLATPDGNGHFSYARTLAAGANTIITVATDNAGNQTTDTRTINLDQTAPVLTITAPADNSKTAQPLATITGTINETSTVTVTVNTGSLQNASITGSDYSATVNLAGGINTITITATDLAGNTTSAVRTVTYDNTNPSLAITDPNQDITTAQNSLTISGTVSDTISSATVTLSFNNQTYTPTVTNGTFSQLLTIPAGGTYAITATATDEAGNSSSATRNVIYVIPVNGVCGSSNGQTQGTAPSINLCTTGTASAITGIGPWNWTCSGSNGGTDATCSTDIQSYSITFTSGGNGTLTGTASQTINYGGSAVEVTAVPATGYHFVNWTEGTTVVGTTAALIISNVTAAHTYTANFAADTPAPVSGACGPSNGGTFTVAPTINFCTTGTASAVIGSGPWSWTCSGTNGGTNTTCNAAIDIIAPILTLSTLADGAITNNATLNVAGTVSDASGVNSLKVNNANVTVTSGNFSHVVTLQAGTNTITTIATDSLGNQTTDTRTITLDQSAPVLTVTAPADNSKTAQPLATISGTISETSTVTVTINNGTPQNTSITGSDYSATVNLTGGINTITIKATDQAGNTSSVVRTVTYDNTNPSLAITDPNQDITTAQNSLTISGTVSDAITSATLTLSFNNQTYTPAVTNGTFSQQLTIPAEGTYAITATATDEAGNSSSVTRNVIYTPPVLLHTGDTNGDNKVDISDALMALRIAVGLIPMDTKYLANGDVAPYTGGNPQPDGKIDISDALLILKKCVGLVYW